MLSSKHLTNLLSFEILYDMGSLHDGMCIVQLIKLSTIAMLISRRLNQAKQNMYWFYIGVLFFMYIIIFKSRINGPTTMPRNCIEQKSYQVGILFNYNSTWTESTWHIIIVINYYVQGLVVFAY